MKWKYHPEKNFICLYEPVKYCLGSGKGQTRHKNRNLLKLYPEMAVWRHKYTAQMQELFEMLFKCKGSECCLIETDRWTWVRDYFCDVRPNPDAKNPSDDQRKNDESHQIPKPTNPMPERKKERIKNLGKAPQQHQEINEKDQAIDKFAPTFKSLSDFETEYKLQQFDNQEKVLVHLRRFEAKSFDDDIRSMFRSTSVFILFIIIVKINPRKDNVTYNSICFITFYFVLYLFQTF